MSAEVSKLEKTYLALKRLDRRKADDYGSPALPVITLLYLIAVLSVPIDSPQKLIWLAAYPIIFSEVSGKGFGRLFVRSLWILPFLLLIGLFNPIFDRAQAFCIGSVVVSRGWVTFISIILRGLLSFQAVLLMVASIGFLDIFGLLRKMGVPVVLCQQLLLTYRNLTLIIEEAIVMQRARTARGFGRSSYPLKMWGTFIGQLLIRSSERATGIHRAMLARGFNGTFPLGKGEVWNRKAFLNLLIWMAIIAILRFVDFSHLIQGAFS